MQASEVAHWMQSLIEKEGCLYQDDVVDMLIRSKHEEHLQENSDGNQVLARIILSEFKKLNAKTVVWVAAGKYWRLRVKEDEASRTARG